MSVIPRAWPKARPGMRPARRPGLRLVVAAGLALACCAPSVDGPAERQRAIDRDDGDRIAALLVQLPGVVTASVVLHHPMRDPLALSPASAAMFGAVITTDDQAAPDALRAAAVRLARAALPELATPSDALPIEIHAVVHRARLAQVGPFSVEAGSARALRAALAIGCLAIAGLAGMFALRHRRGSSAQ